MTSYSEKFFNPFFRVEDQDNLSRSKLLWRIVLVFIGIFGFTFCLTSLYLAMRGVMNLGGFVAYGGPYHIAHKAPNWVWVFPVSILSGLIFIFLNQFNARRVGGLNLLTLLWPAVFLSLGENFLEFGLTPPGQQPAVTWPWLICGILFLIMGGVPLVFIIKNTIKTLSRRAYYEDRPLHSSHQYNQYKNNSTVIPRKAIMTTVIIINLAAIFFGLYLGCLFLQKIST